ncbi:hypothetical protein C8R45DRAFT_1156991 [Mycena sanguinolenta]|nr:hypothetical protein C8R45DRAFT_1156991 [Mycena sanguinolenta]
MAEIKRGSEIIGPLLRGNFRCRYALPMRVFRQVFRPVLSTTACWVPVPSTKKTIAWLSSEALKPWGEHGLTRLESGMSLAMWRDRSRSRLLRPASETWDGLGSNSITAYTQALPDSRHAAIVLSHTDDAPSCTRTARRQIAHPRTRSAHNFGTRTLQRLLAPSIPTRPSSSPFASSTAPFTILLTFLQFRHGPSLALEWNKQSCRPDAAAAARVREAADTRTGGRRARPRFFSVRDVASTADVHTRGLPLRPSSDSPLRYTRAWAREPRGVEPRLLLVRFMHVWEVLSSSPHALAVLPVPEGRGSRISCTSVAATLPAPTQIRSAPSQRWARAQAPAATVRTQDQDCSFGTHAPAASLCPSRGPRLRLYPLLSRLRPPSSPALRSPLKFRFGASAEPPRRSRLRSAILSLCLPVVVLDDDERATLGYVGRTSPSARAPTAKPYSHPPQVARRPRPSYPLPRTHVLLVPILSSSPFSSAAAPFVS